MMPVSNFRKPSKNQSVEADSCRVCASEWDLYFVGGAGAICKECLTCPHGYRSFLRDNYTYCADCAKQVFTERWTFGEEIFALEEYVYFGLFCGVFDDLTVFSYEEADIYEIVLSRAIGKYGTDLTWQSEKDWATALQQLGATCARIAASPGLPLHHLFPEKISRGP